MRLLHTRMVQHYNKSLESVGSSIDLCCLAENLAPNDPICCLKDTKMEGENHFGYAVQYSVEAISTDGRREASFDLALCNSGATSLVIPNLVWQLCQVEKESIKPHLNKGNIYKAVTSLSQGGRSSTGLLSKIVPDPPPVQACHSQSMEPSIFSYWFEDTYYMLELWHTQYA
ncbi:hypothetical protein LguiA_016944 [Lonicera macranthoides]